MHNIFKFIYQQINLFSNTKYAIIILIIIAILEAIFLPIPPDILLITLCLLNNTKSFKFALVCTVASLLGGSCAYFIGYHLWWDGNILTPIAENLITYIPFFSYEKFELMQKFFKSHGFFLIFTAGFTPIPYNIFSISAGINAISYPIFLLSSAISRSLRYFIIAGLIYKYGNKIEYFINLSTTDYKSR